jgi:hypothetical protein
VWISRTNALRGSNTETAALVGGFHDAFIAGAILSILAAFSALFIRDTDASATMAPRRVSAATEPATDPTVITAH